MHTLEAVIGAYGPALARVAASYEADLALREDLLQDILMAIHRALPSLRDETRLAPFVFRIAHNRGVSHVIRERSARAGLVAAAHEHQTETPEQSYLAQERGERLTSAVRRLALPYRQVMTLLLEDLSHAEIGETLGLTVSNVAVRVNRAKAMLKELLNDDQ
jgi:RNA polymerase sigma factor (sigma-70 family)